MLERLFKDPRDFKCCIESSRATENSRENSRREITCCSFLLYILCDVFVRGAI